MTTYPVFNLGQRGWGSPSSAWSPAIQGPPPQHQCPPGQFFDGKSCRGAVAAPPTPPSGMFGSCPHCSRGRGGSALGEKKPPAPGVCCQLDPAGNTVCSDGKIYPAG